MKQYSLNPQSISLDQFKRLTRDRKMIPSRVKLQENLEQRFEAIRKEGITHLGELIRALASKDKAEEFSQKTGLPVDYLVLLKREAGSYLAKPFPLGNFPGIPFEYTELLKTKGIKTCRDFFEKLQSAQEQSSISRETGIPLSRLKELYALCDLSRITGVGGIFARIVYEAGIPSVSEFANTQAPSHYRKYMDHIKKHKYEAGHFSEDDIQYCIDYAKVLNAADLKTGK